MEYVKGMLNVLEDKEGDIYNKPWQVRGGCENLAKRQMTRQNWYSLIQISLPMGVKK